MENVYGIGVANRYALFLDEDSDPLDILKQSEAEQKVAKAKKIEDATKPVAKGPAVKKEAANTRNEADKENQRNRQFEGKRVVDARKAGPGGEPREERNNQRNTEYRRDDDGGRDGGRGRGRGRGEMRGRGRGGEGGGRGGGRGGGEGGRGGKRDFDRKSGDNRTGIKAEDKRGGGGKGQSAKGGTDAITMIEHILKETKAEEAAAHDDELKAQHDYEDSMTKLKEEQKELEESLAQLKVDLAEAEEELLGKKAELKATVAEKEAIEAYLLKIKPGCDFITENIDTRKANRKDEEEALKGAVKLLKDSPAYQTWVAEDHNETLGDCLSICAPDEEDVKCKACLAKVSIPGYCAGHPGTKGC